LDDALEECKYNNNNNNNNYYKYEKEKNDKIDESTYLR
jgi:hypothetical protein